MIYMGSKNRLAKDLVPIIQSYITDETITYVEPFVGGGNVIDKVNCKSRIGYDINKYIISVLVGLRDGIVPPKEVSKEQYIDIKNNKDQYPDFLVGYVGFELSFGSKWFGGYVKRCDKKKHGDIYSYNHCIKQAPNLKDIQFECLDFRELKNLHGCVIYCDPPYKNTTNYSVKDFPYEDFYNWCREMSKDNIVLISEYDMPDDFKCIWKKEMKVTLSSQRKTNDEKDSRVEKLFICDNRQCLKS